MNTLQLKQGATKTQNQNTKPKHKTKTQNKNTKPKHKTKTKNKNTKPKKLQNSNCVSVDPLESFQWDQIWLRIKRINELFNILSTCIVYRGGVNPLAPPGAACQPCMFDIGSKIKLLMCIIKMLFGVFAHTCKNTSVLPSYSTRQTLFSANTSWKPSNTKKR